MSCRDVHKFIHVAAIIRGLKDQLRTIGWLEPTTLGICCEEEPNDSAAEDYDDFSDDIIGKRLSPEAAQIAIFAV